MWNRLRPQVQHEQIGDLAGAEGDLAGGVMCMPSSAPGQTGTSCCEQIVSGEPLSWSVRRGHRFRDQADGLRFTPATSLGDREPTTDRTKTLPVHFRQLRTVIHYQGNSSIEHASVFSPTSSTDCL